MVNYLIYHEHIFKKFIIFSDEYGPVITIGLTRRDCVNLDSQNNILNYKNQIVSIVHQYDRHKDLKFMIKEKYCPESIDANNKFRNIIYFFVILEIFTILSSIKGIKFAFSKSKKVNCINRHYFL